MNLLEPWITPFGLAPFDTISDASFAPAMDAALAQARSGMQAIAKSSDVPTFENTIEAQELAEEPLNQLAAAFYTLASTDSVRHCAKSCNGILRPSCRPMPLP